MTGTTAEASGNPADIQASRGRAIGATPSPSPLTTPPNPPTSTPDGVGEGKLIQVLKDRNVVAGNAQALVAKFPAERIEAAVAYFDALPGEKGPGLLVMAIREGRAPLRRRPSNTIDAQEFSDELAAFWAWCHEHFPDICPPEGHLGAYRVFFNYSLKVADLSVEEHGPLIRASVKAYNERYPETKGQ